MGIAISFLLRQSSEEAGKDIFNCIISTGKITCPHGHYDGINLVLDNGVYSFTNMNWQANKFLNKIKIGDYILIFQGGMKEALVVRVTSQPQIGVIETIKVLRQKNCTQHSPLNQYCELCRNEKKEIFSVNYLLQNIEDYTRFLNENYSIENMHTIYRNIEVIGKINTDSLIYHKYKCFRTSICEPSEETILTPEEILPI
jgi:hypothetical protein